MPSITASPIFLFLSLLLIAGSLSLASSAATVLSRYQDACDGDDHGTAGDFDLYVLSQSWSAEFCYSHREYPGCVKPTPWQRVNLTLHGLWPQYSADRGGYEWPQCCASEFSSNLSASVVKSLLPQLQLYWPNEEDPSVRALNASLYQHEWAKHGTCSGLPQLDFLSAALNLTAALHTPAVISSNIGGSVSRDELESAFNAGSPCGSDSCQVFLECSAGQYLLEVHTCFSLQLKRVDCPATVTSQAERCKAGKVKITKFSS